MGEESNCGEGRRGDRFVMIVLLDVVDGVELCCFCGYATEGLSRSSRGTDDTLNRDNIQRVSRETLTHVIRHSARWPHVKLLSIANMTEHLMSEDSHSDEELLQKFQFQRLINEGMSAYNGIDI
jgi:hypothetical protein